MAWIYWFPDTRPRPGQGRVRCSLIHGEMRRLKHRPDISYCLVSVVLLCSMVIIEGHFILSASKSWQPCVPLQNLGEALQASEIPRLGNCWFTSSAVRNQKLSLESSRSLQCLERPGGCGCP